MGDLLRCVIKHWPAVIGCNLTNSFLFRFSEQAMVDAEVRSGSNGAKAAMKHWHEGAAAGAGASSAVSWRWQTGGEPMIILMIYFIHFDWRVFSSSNSYHEVPQPQTSLHSESSISISNLLAVANSITRLLAVARAVLFFRAVKLSMTE